MKKWEKYSKTFSLAFQNALEYRVDFLLSIISGVFIIIVQCALWRAVFASSSNEIINGYTYQEMIIYSVFSGIVSKLVSTGFEGEVAADIKSGGLSKYLTQPINYRMYRFQKFIGGKLMKMVVVMCILAVSMTIFIGQWGLYLKPFMVIGFVVSVILGMILNFCIFYIVSNLAFIMTEVWGVFIAVNQGSYLLSGGIFPLDVFGDKVYQVVHLLPFEYTVFFPVNIINGHLTLQEVLQGIVVQAIWIVILNLLGVICWKQGLKKYVAVGG